MDLRSRCVEIERVGKLDDSCGRGVNWAGREVARIGAVAAALDLDSGIAKGGSDDCACRVFEM